MIYCPLCNFEFAKGDHQCTTECPFMDGCDFLCCPNCGYLVPDESRSAVVKLLRRFWNRSAVKNMITTENTGNTEKIKEETLAK